MCRVGVPVSLKDSIARGAARLRILSVTETEPEKLVPGEEGATYIDALPQEERETTEVAGSPVGPEIDSETVTRTRQTLLSAVYKQPQSKALSTFMEQHEVLDMLPPDQRLMAALATTRKLGFAKDAVLKALESALSTIDLGTKEFLRQLGDEERHEVGSRESKKDSIDTELARLHQEEQKLDTQKSQILVEIEEQRRAFGSKRSSYEVASETAVEDLTKMRTALQKA